MSFSRHMHSTRSAGWTVLIITVHLHNLVLIASLILSICHVGLPALARIEPTGTVDWQLQNRDATVVCTWYAVYRTVLRCSTYTRSRAGTFVDPSATGRKASLSGANTAPGNNDLGP